MKPRLWFNKISHFPVAGSMAIIAIFFIGYFMVLNNTTTHAVSATDFKAGRIIDDSVFYNKDTMSVQQIQSFLDRLIPSCDVWGTGQSEYGGGTRAQYAASRGWAGPPYVCLNKYYENPNTGETSFEKGGGQFDGGQSTAQIIYDAAQRYNINPQVVLVLLKKESAGPLTSDNWPLKSQYKYAMGYGCPDSGPGYSANCDSSKAGLYKQIDLAAWQLKYYKDHSNDYRYRLGWNDIQFSPDPACGTKRVYIENIATLSLYIYTPYTPNDASLTNYPGTASCGAYGNRNFFMFFSEWFGSPSTPAPMNCDSKVKDIVCVWSVRKSDGSQFLTASEIELKTTVYNYGWVNEGIAYYASSTTQQGALPVHRLRKDNVHYYTEDESEYISLKNTRDWLDEGIVFYAPPANTSINVSYPVYKLRNPSNGQYYWTTNESQKNSLVATGFVVETNSFNSFSGLMSPTSTVAGRDNVYSLNKGSSYLYSTSLTEADSAIMNGFQYKGILTTANVAKQGTPVYRLRKNTNYLYTTNPSEQDLAVNNYGYTSEGIGFYIDNDSSQVYRLANLNGTYFYTGAVSDVMSLVNTNGWRYEGGLTDNYNSTSYPVYRLLNLINGRHFYTTNINEAMKITNKGWLYETIAFNASAGSGQPVYRLRMSDKYLYTSNENEKNVAINKYGYAYEGIGFYANPTSTNKPVYRLQGRNDEYFYTASTQEKDTAISKYGYNYEGESFYLSPDN